MSTWIRSKMQSGILSHLSPTALDESSIRRAPNTSSYAEVHREPPPEIGIIVGDFVHNLRCAFDHVMWALARSIVTPPLVPDYCTQFPIFDKASSFYPGRPSLGIPDPG